MSQILNWLLIFTRDEREGVLCQSFNRNNLKNRKVFQIELFATELDQSHCGEGKLVQHLHVQLVIDSRKRKRRRKSRRRRRRGHNPCSSSSSATYSLDNSFPPLCQ